MLNDLPKEIDPIHLAQQSVVLKGEIDFDDMPRLQSSLNDKQGKALFEWHFTQDEDNHHLIQGHIGATVGLICQRCLKPVAWVVNQKVGLMILTQRHTENDLPGGYDALELEHNPIQLISLVEDELILALPIIANHDVCPKNEYQQAEQWEEFREHSNPFSVLKNLKND
ncbi:YceD family protein [Candidatus Albibeggiatoa sp. nov. BB20]|uniref:YceD family protein n=1 Tax=Candidatus Albibeggiatoa sp. nov. BB20 TaxID=3162723 RepID=UPI003365B131